MLRRPVQILGLLAVGFMIGFAGLALAVLLARAGGGDALPPLSYLGGILGFTLKQAGLSVLLSVAGALPVALAMARFRHFPGRGLVIALMLVPLGLPVLPGIFGLLEIWGRQGSLNQLLQALGLPPFSPYGLSGILLAHVFFNLPLAARLLLVALDAIPAQQWRLAASLDLQRLSLFRFVEWPAMLRVLPGIAGLIFMLCMTSFTIVLTLGGGPSTSTLEVALYQALKFEFDPARAAILILLQLVLTIAVFRLLALFSRPETDKVAQAGASFIGLPAGWVERTGFTTVLVAFVGLVAAPLLAIFLFGLRSGLQSLFTQPVFWQALGTSLTIALGAGLLSASLTVAIAYAAQDARMRWAKSLVLLYRLPDLMLVLPPLALGSGWFLILLAVDLADHLAPLVVLVINALMAMPFAMRLVGPAIATHLERTDRLAQSLDIRGVSRLKIIDWPVLRQPVLAGLGFAMALSLGDLGAIALFSSDGFITLPSLLYARLGSYRSGDAAGLSLILAGLSLLLMVPALMRERTKPGEFR